MMREKIYEKLYISWWIRSIRSARIDRMLWEQLHPFSNFKEAAAS